jgi:hypothetical protein
MADVGKVLVLLHVLLVALLVVLVVLVVLVLVALGLGLPDSDSVGMMLRDALLNISGTVFITIDIILMRYYFFNALTLGYEFN